MLSIIITAIIAGMIGIAIGAGSKNNLIRWGGDLWQLVAGSPNRCPHNLSLGHGQINGVRVRGCYNCYNVYVNARDAAKVQYER